jgi:hypothetical protein
MSAGRYVLYLFDGQIYCGHSLPLSLRRGSRERLYLFDMYRQLITAGETTSIYPSLMLN